MDKKNFKTFQFEIGFKYKAERSKDQIADAFEKLIALKAFDGIKNVGSKRARLTSADNTLSLLLTQDGLIVSFKNMQLRKVLIDDFQQVAKLLKEANNLLKFQGFNIEVSRSRHLFYSTTRKDRNYVINETIASKHQSELDAFQIALDFGDDVGFSNISMNLSNEHTTRMHKVFEEHGRLDDLSKLINIYSAYISTEDPDEKEIGRYLQDVAQAHVDLTVLERIGYEG